MVNAGHWGVVPPPRFANPNSERSEVASAPRARTISVLGRFLLVLYLALVPMQRVQAQAPPPPPEATTPETITATSAPSTPTVAAPQESEHEHDEALPDELKHASLAKVFGLDFMQWALVAIAFSIHAVGILLTFGTLIIPAVSALLLTRRISHTFTLAALFGAVPIPVGLYFSFIWDLSPGALIVAISAVLLVACGLLSRLRHLVPICPKRFLAHTLHPKRLG